MSAKMQHIADELKTKTEGIFPYIYIEASDKLCSNIHIRLSVTPFDRTDNCGFYNSRHVLIHVFTKTGRDYTVGDLVETSCTFSSPELPKLRKKSGDADTIIKHIVSYCEKLKERVIWPK